MKLSRVLVTFGAVLLLAGGANAADTPKEEKATKVIPPSSRVMVKGAAKSAGAKQLAKGTKSTSAKAYGFTTGISKEKGSFKLGVLLADLESALLAGDKDKSIKATDTLAQGLTVLGSPMPLIMSVVNIKSTLAAGTKPEAVSAASMPVVRPFIDDFIVKEGKTAYLKLGEWAESTRLALVATKKDSLPADFLNGLNMAAYFLDQLKGQNLPQGAVDALTQLAAMENTKITQVEVKAALKALTTISDIMS